MTLQKQSIPIPFAQGIDTKTDEKQVVAGKLLLLENGIFVSPMRISKRNGYEKIARAGTVGKACAAYKDEILAFDGTNARSYSDTTDSFNVRGYKHSLQIGSRAVVANDSAQTGQDSCYHAAGYEAFAWEDARGGVRYSVIDATTRQQIVADTSLDSSGSRPRVFALGNYILFTYYLSGKVCYKKIAITAPTTLSSRVDLVSTVNTTYPNWDGIVIGERLFLIWNDTTGTNSVSITYLLSNLTMASPVNIGSTNANGTAAVWSDADQNAWFAWYDGTNIKGAVYNYNLTAVVTIYTIETIANVKRITGIEYSRTSTLVNACYIFYDVSAAATYNYLTRANTLARSSTTVTPGTPAVFMRSVGLGTKAFMRNSTVHVGLTYDSTTQPTYFIATHPARTIVAKIAHMVGGGLATNTVLPQVNAMSTTKWMVALLRKTRLYVQSGRIWSVTGVNAVTIEDDTSNAWLRAEMANTLHMTGGFLSMYDGAGVVEHGFHLYPESPSTTIATTTGGIGAGTYQYQVVYEWTDNEGNTHRSAPSQAVSATTVAGSLTFTANSTLGSTTLTSVSSTANLFVGQLITNATNIAANTYIAAIPTANTITMTNAAIATNTGFTVTTTWTNKITLTIPTLRITAKEPTYNSRANVALGVYRTQNAGTIFYKVSSIASPTLNDTTADTVSFVDTWPDTYLNGNELLYTTGGVLENISPPGVALISTYKRRLVVVPSENRQSYWISKAWIPGTPVEFTDSFVKSIDARDGDITAIAELDEKEILFKRNTAWVTAGNGPNDTGQSDDLAEPELITTAEGCVNPRSVVITPVGLMRQTTKGIYLLDRSLQDSYIGAEVEAYNNLTITAAVLVPDTNQVRFTTADGTVLVFDYIFRQWSVFTNHEVVDACVFNDRFAFIDAIGRVHRETPGVYVDNGRCIRLKAKTSWLSFAGLQGFQRVWQMLFLGDYKSDHRLIVTAAYDFNPNPTQQVYVDAGTLLGTGAYGDGATYGADTPYGEDYPLYQFRVFLTRQKCQSIQIGFEEVQDETTGEGLSLSALNFLVGIKSGTYKVNPTSSFA